MMAKQLLATGGLWLEFNGTQICLDPGPGALVRAAKKKLDPARLEGILISHRHLDHCADANVMIEAMTESGRRKRGVLFAPPDALQTDPVVLKYLRSYPEKIVELEAEKEYQIGNICFRTSLFHRHGDVTTFGFIFETGTRVVAYIADTAYFEELKNCYRGDVLIICLLLLEPREILHLAVPDAQEIIQALEPKLVLLTHFGMGIYQARPWKIAASLSRATGVQVVAARDGMRVVLP